MPAYVGVNGIARKIGNIYVGVDGVARKVIKGYAGDANGIAQLIYSAGGGWFGDGSDGDLALASTMLLPVVADTGHIFKQYNSITINSGGLLQPANRCAGMVILCKNDCTINLGGTISMDKMAPRRSDATEQDIRTNGESSPWLQLVATLTGGRGGNGGSGYLSTNLCATGGVGGNGFWAGGGYGGGGGASGKSTGSNAYYKGGGSEPRPLSSIAWPQTSNPSADATNGAGGSTYAYYTSGRTAAGGNAPGGGGAYGEYQGGWYIYNGAAGSAYGGGFLMLVVGGKLTIAGTLTANGGNGGDGGLGSRAGTAGGGGGGGGGGIIAVLSKNAPSITGNLRANGGTGGKGGSPNNTAHTIAPSGAVGTVYTARLSDGGEITSA